VSRVSPHFLLRLGSVASDSTRPVGGPVRIGVSRCMGGGADALEVELAARRGIAPGDEASAELGFDGETETVFTGSVVEVAATLVGVRVLALGRMDRLLRLRLARSYEERSVGAIVRDLADAAGVDVGQADEGPTLPRFALDGRLNAGRQLRALADRLGFELYTDRDGRLMFRALGAAAALDGGGLGGLAAAAGGAAQSLLGGGSGTGYQVGKHLIAARAAHRVTGLEQVQVGGEGPASSHGSQSSWWLSTGADQNHGSAGSGSAATLIFDAAARTKDLADRFAAGYLASASRGTHTLWLRTLGRAALELGDAVQVSAAADEALNRSGYVRAVTHRCSSTAGFVSDIGVEVEAA